MNSPALLAGLALFASPLLPAAERDDQVRGDLEALKDDTLWTYNDLAAGLAKARQSGKPLFVVLRCIPCHACATFDGEVVRRAGEIADLMEQFVCVRLIQANALDLGLFQFDYDLSFAAFFLAADETILGRFGTRSVKKAVDADKEVSLQGLRESMQSALDLHANLDTHRASLAKKRGPAPAHPTPLGFPALKNFQEKLDYQGKLAGSCVHCHMIGEAERKEVLDARKPLSDKLLFPWPNPSVTGFSLRVDRRATVATVAPDSPAARAGLRAGDEILTMDGQPIVSIADIQWVLHQAPDSARIPLTLRREGKGKATDLALVLGEGWRHQSDIAWRASTWDLRRLAFGGMVLEPATAGKRRELNIPDDKLALRVQHTGKYNDHAIAHHAGVQVDDIVTSLAGLDQNLTESLLLARILETRRSGDTIEATLHRGDKEVTAKLRLP